LFVHGTIEGGAMNKLVDYELFDEDVISYDTVKKFKAVYAGHLHDAQHFKNVWYPGSIERLAFGDELSLKSFLYVTEDKTESIALYARQMVTMGYAQLPELKAGRFSVKDAIVRITGVAKGEMQSTRKALMDAGCYHIAGLHSADQIVNELPKATGINISEFVRRYAEKAGYKGNVEAATQIILDTVDNQS
jgi:DNA repair exonuclease SbcCD nuclease subunit